MKSLLVLTILTTAFYVHASKLTNECLGEVVSAVNTQHTLAEGAVFALRVLHEGEYASAVLVGHSDETDPTDYLVTVQHQGNKCEARSITVASEAGDVTEYTDADQKLATDAYAARKKVITAKALALMDKIPVSEFDIRVICVIGNKVIGQVPMTHWSANDRKTMTGTLNKFPTKTTDGGPKIKIIAKNAVRLTGNEHEGMFQVDGYVNDKRADVCIEENKPVLE